MTQMRAFAIGATFGKRGLYFGGEFVSNEWLFDNPRVADFIKCGIVRIPRHKHHGSVGNLECTWRATSIPFMPGIAKSNNQTKIPASHLTQEVERSSAASHFHDHIAEFSEHRRCDLTYRASSSTRRIIAPLRGGVTREPRIPLVRRRLSRAGQIDLHGRAFANAGSQFACPRRIAWRSRALGSIPTLSPCRFPWW